MKINILALEEGDKKTYQNKVKSFFLRLLSVNVFNRPNFSFIMTFIASKYTFECCAKKFLAQRLAILYKGLIGRD